MLYRLPEIRQFDRKLGFLDDCSDLQFVILGCLFIPFTEQALERQDVALLERIGNFLEEASTAALQDQNMASVLRIEVGEWLERTPYEAQIEPYLLINTRKITHYIPGLAVQRHQRQEKAIGESFKMKIRRIWRKGKT
jgi:hypothetical protein